MLTLIAVFSGPCVNTACGRSGDLPKRVDPVLTLIVVVLETYHACTQCGHCGPSGDKPSGPRFVTCTVIVLKTSQTVRISDIDH